MASSVTYLDLGLGNVLGLEGVSAVQPLMNGERLVTYQIADHDLALANETGAFSGHRLDSVAGRLDGLLNATSRCGGSSRATRAAARRAAARGLALGRDDLVERLINLAGHVDGVDVVCWDGVGR